MTIDSVAITKAATLNTGNNEIRIPSTSTSGTIEITIPANPILTRMESAGVPIPYQGVSDTTELLLKNELGVEVPAQYDVLARWPDGSIRWVLVTAVVTGSATADTLYSLDYGAGVTQASYSTNLSYQDNANDYVVDNGVIRVTLDKTTGDLIKTIYGDSAQDDSYSSQLTGESIFAIDDANAGDTFASTHDAAPVWSVVYNGINLLQFKAEVRLKNAGGTNSLKLIAYISIYNSISGVDYTEVDVQITLEDDRQQNDILHFFPVSYTEDKDVDLALSEVRLQLDVHPATATDLLMGGEDQAGSTNFISSLDRAGGESETIRQDGEWNWNNNAVMSSDPTKDGSHPDINYGGEASGSSQSFSGPITGSRCKGYAQLATATDRAIAIIPLHFWQNWPQAMTADQDGFLYKFYDGPDSPTHETEYRLRADGGMFRRPQSLYNPRPGMAKTYSFKIVLNPVSVTPAATINNIHTNYHNYEPGLRCSANHYCTSKGFWDMVPRNADSSTYDDSLRDLVLNRSESVCSHFNLCYGWRDFGDRQRPGYESNYHEPLPTFYNDTHVGANNYIALWARTLHYGWLRFAYDATRHFMDIAVSHSTVVNYGPLNLLTQPVPAGMPRLFKHNNDDHEGRLHDGHYHCSGLSYMYFLTGNQRAKAVMERVADYTKYYIQGRYVLPRATATGKVGTANTRQSVETLRDHGWFLYGANQHVKMTNDSDYFLEVNKLAMDFWVEWWKDQRDHLQDNVVVGQNDYTQGTGYWTVDNLDSAPDGWNGTMPWTDSAMVASAIEFIEMDEQYNTGIDRAECKMMLYQVMEYIFTWGYRDDVESFVHNEATYYTFLSADSAKQLIGSFARIYLWLKADIAASNLTATEQAWFRPDYYKQKIIHHVNQWRQTAHQQQSYGFYGYELPFPHTIWTYITQIEAE